MMVKSMNPAQGFWRAIISGAMAGWPIRNPSRALSAGCAPNHIAPKPGRLAAAIATGRGGGATGTCAGAGNSPLLEFPPRESEKYNSAAAAREASGVGHAGRSHPYRLATNRIPRAHPLLAASLPRQGDPHVFGEQLPKPKRDGEGGARLISRSTHSIHRIDPTRGHLVNQLEI